MKKPSIVLGVFFAFLTMLLAGKIHAENKKWIYLNSENKVVYWEEEREGHVRLYGESSFMNVYNKQVIASLTKGLEKREAIPFQELPFSSKEYNGFHHVFPSFEDLEIRSFFPGYLTAHNCN